jgi:hypothetical protein
MKVKLNGLSKQHRMLKLHGVPIAAAAASSMGSVRKSGRLRAYVAGLDVPVLMEALPLLLSPIVAQGGRTRWIRRRPDERRRSPSLSKAERLAVRAVYALGASSAVVEMELDAKGDPAVSSIRPVSGFQMRRLLDKHGFTTHEDGEHGALGGAVEADRDAAGPFRMGADVELVLKDGTGRVVPAERYLPRGGEAGCDPVQWEGRLAYALMELRPLPAGDADALLRSLLRAMRLADKRIGDRTLAWLSGGLPHDELPIGGHLHFSGVALTERLLRALDNYLALPTVMLEDEASLRRRPRFGFLGDFRRKPHGGFEYRTLPSWMATPQIALGLLTLAQLVARNAEQLKQRPLHDPDVQAHFYAGRKEALRHWIPLLWSDLERLPEYAAYRRRLDGLKQRLLRGESWDGNADIRPAWKIIPGEMKVGNEREIMV